MAGCPPPRPRYTSRAHASHSFPAPLALSDLLTSASTDVDWLWNGCLARAGVTLLTSEWKEVPSFGPPAAPEGAPKVELTAWHPRGVVVLPRDLLDAPVGIDADDDPVHRVKQRLGHPHDRGLRLEV